MATKNIVPNDNGEGGIGVTAKRWSTAFINTVTGNVTGNLTGQVLTAAQTNINSILATDLIIGEDAQTAIDFGTVNEIDFKVDNANRLTLTSSVLAPATTNQIDLGTSSLEFKDAFFDGTVTADAFAGPLTGNVTGNVSGTAATVTGAAQSNITSLGTLTSLSISGDLTVSGGDVTLGAAATAGTLSLVASAHGAVGNSLTISGGSTTAGTTDDIAGGSLILTGGAGKGTGDGGSVIIKSATKGSSGSSLNAINDTIATFASDLSTTFAGGVAIAGASSLPVSNSKNGAGIQIPTNKQLGFGNGATSKPDFGFAVDGTSGDAKLEIFCGTGGDAVDAFFNTSGLFKAAALQVTDSGAIGCESDADLLTLTANNLLINGGTVNNKINTLFASQNSSTAAHTSGFKFCNDGNGGIYYDSSADDLSIFANQASSNIFLRTAGDIALTLDSSQNATVAGTLTSTGDFKTGSATTVAPVAAADNLIIDPGVAAVGMSIISTSAGSGTIKFGDAEDADIGGITYVHSSGSDSNEMIFTANATNVVTFKSTGNVEIADGDLVIGTANHGIDFSNETPNQSGAGAASSSLLDDYEEGTWTPTLVGANGAVAQSNSSETKGFYTKIGRLVHCSGQLILTDLTSTGGTDASGSIQMGGYPFVNQDAEGAQSGGVIGAASNLSITAGHSVGLVMLKNAQNANFNVTDSTGGTTDMQASEFSDNGNISFSITYMTVT
tara:strand:+ start:716 stop:2890 length:2175 start_codon:yes stop_codon:yes gene_type:complete